MTRVLVTRSESHPVRVELVREELSDHEVTDIEVPAGGIAPDCDETLIGALAGTEGLLLRPGNVTRLVIENAPDLRVIAVHGSGYDHIDIKAAMEHGIVVTHSPEAPAPAVVEHAFGAIFTLLRDFPETFRETAAGNWAGAKHTLTELSECTVGVVGLGTIGFDVARHASQVFDADVIGHDPYVAGESTSPIFPRYDRTTVEAAGVELVSKDDLFERANVVSLHVPLTEETRGMIGERELCRLEEGYLVNLARGGVVDEDALWSVVEEGLLAGAFLDVMEAEPPAEDDPLLSAPGVLVTPHIGGVTNAYFERAPVIAARKIRAVLEGDRPPMVVNPQVFDE